MEQMERQQDLPEYGPHVPLVPSLEPSILLCLRVYVPGHPVLSFLPQQLQLLLFLSPKTLAVWNLVSGLRPALRLFWPW